jgi:hypothetical protein
MDKEPNIVTLAVVLVAGWFCVAYGSVHIRDRAPSPPTELDQIAYKAAKEVLANQTNVVDALVTPQVRYEQDVARHRNKRMAMLGLLAAGGIVTFRSGFLLAESCGRNGWLGGTLAVLFGPVSLAWGLQRSRGK